MVGRDASKCYFTSSLSSQSAAGSRGLLINFAKLFFKVRDDFHYTPLGFRVRRDLAASLR
jgi:hypothetical protein